MGWMEEDTGLPGLYFMQLWHIWYGIVSSFWIFFNLFEPSKQKENPSSEHFE